MRANSSYLPSNKPVAALNTQSEVFIHLGLFDDDREPYLDLADINPGTTPTKPGCDSGLEAFFMNIKTFFLPFDIVKVLTTILLILWFTRLWIDDRMLYLPPFSLSTALSYESEVFISLDRF